MYSFYAYPFSEQAGFWNFQQKSR